jgi:Rhs element Vgr protein
MPVTIETDWLQITAEGSPLSPAVLSKVISMEIESTYNRPTLCVLRFNADPGEDPVAALDLGKKLVVKMKGDANPAKTIFDGDVTAVEIDSSMLNTELVVVAHDRLHKLFRGDKSRVFVQTKVSDIAQTMAGEHGLSADVTATTDVHPYLAQTHISDGDYLASLVADVGFHVAADGNKLVVKAFAADSSAPVALEFGTNLQSFSAKATASAFLKEATTFSWDPKTKKENVGKASTTPATKDTKVAAAFNGTPKALVERMAGTQSQDTKLAQAAIDRAIAPNRQLDGRAFGNADIHVDGKVKVERANTRFNGEYRVSRVRHLYTNEEGFVTEFSCRGGADDSLAGLVSRTAVTEAAVAAGPAPTLRIGIVTNNNDTEGMGRVKVKFPTLDKDGGKDIESDWLRVVTPGGGKDRGLFLMPEVDDEVLVLVGHGDYGVAYVLGGLYNGKDPTALPIADAVKNGKVEQRALKTRAGNQLLFDDKDGKEAIELKTAKGHMVMRFEEGTGLKITNTDTANVVIMNADGDITIESKSGNLNLKASKDIVMTSASGKISMSASAGDISADAMNVKLNASVGAEVKGTASAKLEASGQTTVKGAMVMIN